MRDDIRARREAEIEQAAYALLAEKGFAGTSMLSIARRAHCSNETLYNWYGDKLGLMRRMISRNAAEARTLLSDAAKTAAPLAETLAAFGPVLLTMLLGERAVTLNRAAAADATGVLGRALAEEGRDTVRPLVRAVFAAAETRGDPAVGDPDAATDLYLTLLIGDLQIRRVIGRLPEPGRAELDRRSESALRHLMALLPLTGR